MLITLTWGWKYGLLSALAGGCQSLWYLWGPSNGYAVFFVVPPFTLWIIWHGICADLRRKQKDHKWWLNIYAVEVPFRILSTINLYTLSRWAITLNPPPWDWASNSTNIISLHFSNFVVIKQAVVGYIVLLLADVLLKFKFIRTFFKQKGQYHHENTGYIMSAFIAFGILFWVFDSILGFMVFYDDISFLDLLALNVPSQQTWARAFVIVACLICGLITIRMFYRKQEIGKALQESEDDFKKLLEYAPVAIAVLDKNENTEYANRKYVETIGYTDNINLIKKWSAEVEKALREGKEIEPSEYNVTCKDGKVRVMEISGTFVTDKLVTIFIDLTKRKLSEEALAESEEKFRLLAENSVDCIWMMNTRLKFTYLSPSVERMMGFKAEQWVGTTLRSHFRKKEFLKVSVLAAKSLKNYKTFDYVVFETKMLNSKNEEVDIEISGKALLNSKGKLIGLQGVTKDITERKKAEKILKDSKIKLQLLYDSSSDAIMLLDEKGFFDCNEATLRLFGCANREEFCSRHPADFSPPTQPDGTDSMIYARNNIAVALKEGSKRFEHLHRRLDGTDFPAEVLLDALMLEGRKVLQARVYDITERKQVYEELAKYRDHLEELVRKRTAELVKRVAEVEQLNIEMVNLSEGLQISNKSLEATTHQLGNANKELEAFAYSVSHDLRAPLRNIDGFSQILLEDYSGILDKQGRHYLQRVRAGTQNMGQLIDDILSLSRSGRHPMDKKTINMESIVREVCKSLKNELKDRKIDFVVHECSPALADSHLVKIVLTNLLSNALKFTRMRENAKIEIGSMTEDGHTAFFIKDNGAGFDMKYADKLFVAFQRLHRAEDYEGSGIGLAIVQRIIHRHGGRIWAESEIDVGTTFYFTLPG